MDGRRAVAISFAVIFTLMIAPPANARPTPCGSAKLKTTAQNATCRLAREAREASGGSVSPAREQRCADRMHEAFAHIEATHRDCPAEGEVEIVQHLVDSFIAGVDTALSSATANGCQATKLKATGKKVECVLAAHARSAATARPVAATTLQRCHHKLTARFAEAEAKAKHRCATTGDAEAIEYQVDSFADDALQAIVEIDRPPTTTSSTSLPANLSGSYIFSGAQVGPGCPFSATFLSSISLTQSGDTLIVNSTSPSCAFGANAQLVPGGFTVSCGFQGGVTCAGGFGDPGVNVEGLLPGLDGTIQVSQRTYYAPLVPGPCDGCRVEWAGTMSRYP